MPLLSKARIARGYKPKVFNVLLQQFGRSKCPQYWVDTDADATVSDGIALLVPILLAETA